MNELKDREIFAVGTWNGIDFGEDDLDDIVANFDKLLDKHKVPLKFGHNDEQDITDGQPAIGWVEKVYRQGKKLLADFVNVPTVVVEAIKNKLYRSVSVELLFNVDANGDKFNHVLDAVAILGADHPAVNNLADLDILLAARTEFSGGHRVMFNTVEGLITKEEDIDMDAKEIQKMIDDAVAPLTEANAKLSADNADLKAKLATKDKEDELREEAVKKEKIEAARKSVNEILNEAVNQKAMLPALRESYAKQIGVDDDERVVDIDLEQVRVMCGATKPIDDKPKGKDGMDDDAYKDIKDPGEKLMRMTKDHQAKHNVESFSAAFKVVCSANPELHVEYLDSNGEVRS